MEVSGSASSGFGQAVIDVHGGYRATRLTFEPPDELISDVVTGRVLRPHLVRSVVFLAAFLFLVLLYFLTFLILLVAAASNPARLIFANAAGAELVPVAWLMLLLILQGGVILAWVVSLFAPARESISEYGLLIEGRAEAHAVAYSWIVETVRGRRSPFRVTMAQVSGVPVVTFRNGRDHALVLVQPKGGDLYLGWTMWRARSTVVVLGHLIRDFFQVSDAAADIRAASSRALRELVHSVTREGVQAAILNPPVDDATARTKLAWLPSLNERTGGTPATEAPMAPPNGSPAMSSEHTVHLTEAPPDKQQSTVVDTSWQPRRRRRRVPVILSGILTLILLTAVVAGIITTRQPSLAAEAAAKLFDPPLMMGGQSFATASEGNWNLAEWNTGQECNPQWTAWTSTLESAQASSFSTHSSGSWIATYIFENGSQANEALKAAAPAWTACYGSPQTGPGQNSGNTSGATWAQQAGSAKGDGFNEVFVNYGNIFSVNFQSSETEAEPGFYLPGNDVASALVERIKSLT